MPQDANDWRGPNVVTLPTPPNPPRRRSRSGMIAGLLLAVGCIAALVVALGYLENQNVGQSGSALNVNSQPAGLSVGNGSAFGYNTTASTAAPSVGCPQVVISTSSLRAEVQDLIRATQACWLAGDFTGLQRYVPSASATLDLAQPFPLGNASIQVIRVCYANGGSFSYDFTQGGKMGFANGSFAGDSAQPALLDIPRLGYYEDGPNCPA